jgi:hypothetical protein
MSAKTNRRTRAVIGVLATIAMLAAMPAASAHRPAHEPGHDVVVARGTCSADSTWALRLIEHRRRIAVAFRVDSDTPGEPWLLKLRHGRRLVFVDVRRSSGPDGFVGMRRVVRNTRGLDMIGARAVNLETRERCTGRAAI